MIQALKQSSTQSIRPASSKGTTGADESLKSNAKDIVSSSPSPSARKDSTEEALEFEKSKQQDEDGFDLLIIGGGATGTGVAVDAATRGLSVAMVERDDFGAGE